MKLTVQCSFYLMMMMFPLIQLHKSVEANEYEDCRWSFQCGNVNISYPFYGNGRPSYCGHPGFEFNCRDDGPEISVTTSSERYFLRQMDQNSQTISVARRDLGDSWGDFCPESWQNTTLNFSLYSYPHTPVNVSFYFECYDPPTSPAIRFPCSSNGFGYFVPPSGAYYRDILLNRCNENIIVPVHQSDAPNIGDIRSLETALRNGFELNWTADYNSCHECREIGGVCGSNDSTGRFACYCADENDNPICYGNSAGNSRRALIIGVSVGALGAAALLCCCAFIVLRRRRRSLSQAQSKDLGLINMSNGLPPSNEFRSSEGYTTSPSTYLSQSFPSSYPSSKSDFENSADHLGIKVFGYDELEKATEHFHESHELGDGGFGTVYYGKLNDGRLVAVKRLYENSCRHMGQFLNEIHILNRLRHKNLVTLYGCTSRRSRDLLLVYEYISNGTVADHLHGKLAHSNVLPWPTRLSIAVETAEALCFLHENDVIHRDVKTTNILLENNFRVKVADFGLSRLFPDNVTHVSTAPQGTPGYVDPEYYQCYQLTEKSDVFSFGVVLAELLSSKVAVDISRHRHDINLANMALDRIQKHAFDELIDPKLGFEKDFLAQKMLKLIAEVAFQCLQQEKEARPTMKEVLESLKAIQKEMENSQQQVVLDIHERDDIGLLKNAPPPLSPGTDNSNMSII